MMARPLMFGTCVCLCSAAVAADSPQQDCAALEEALVEETTLLAGVTDAESAVAVMPQLRACLARLSAMRGTDEDALWTYIDNTPEVKTRMIEVMERLAAQFTRLEQAGFHGSAELEAALVPQLQSPEE